MKLPGPLAGRGCVFDQGDQEFGTGYIALEGECEKFFGDLLAIFTDGFESGLAQVPERVGFSTPAGCFSA
ncbi:MAG: hypothetical protein WB608_09555 [Terracidiphilus sp.]